MNIQEQESKEKANLDYAYGISGIVSKESQKTGSPTSPIDYRILEKVDTLVRALGTMVLFPDEVSDPLNVGKKIYRGTKQMPILLDENRELALAKLKELIEKL